MLKSMLLLLFSGLSTSPAIVTTSPATSPAISTTLSMKIMHKVGLILGEHIVTTPYIAKLINLNNNKTPEVMVYLQGHEPCQYSSGYTLFIFSQKHHHLEIIGRINAVLPPIIVSNTKTQGWRNIIFMVGKPYHRAQTCFNGEIYPNSKPKLLTQSTKGVSVITYANIRKYFQPPKSLHPDCSNKDNNAEQSNKVIFVTDHNSINNTESAKENQLW